MKKFFLLFIMLLTACSTTEIKNDIVLETNKSNITAGERLLINYNAENVYQKVYASLINNNNSVLETYSSQKFGTQYSINRIIKSDVINSYDNYRVMMSFVNNEDIKNVFFDINIDKSIIITDLCSSENCLGMSGNILNNSKFKINVKAFKILPVRFTYDILTPYNSYSFENNFNSPVENDWLENISIDPIPDDISFYIALFKIKA